MFIGTRALYPTSMPDKQCVAHRDTRDQLRWEGELGFPNQAKSKSWDRGNRDRRFVSRYKNWDQGELGNQGRLKSGIW